MINIAYLKNWFLTWMNNNSKSVQAYTTKLNLGNAYWMAKFSELVYYQASKENPFPDEKRILEELKQEDKNFISVTGVSHKSSQAVLIEHEHYFSMAFRGTSEPSDWLDNINVFYEPVLFGGFHRGFCHAFLDIWDALFAHYNQLNAQKKPPLFLTGHSLGGALATVAASWFIHHDLPFISAYTFGQPRVMTRAAARIFNVEAKPRCFRF